MIIFVSIVSQLYRHVAQHTVCHKNRIQVGTLEWREILDGDNL
jgi:hypothetical protein